MNIQKINLPSKKLYFKAQLEIDDIWKKNIEDCAHPNSKYKKNIDEALLTIKNSEQKGIINFILKSTPISEKKLKACSSVYSKAVLSLRNPLYLIAQFKQTGEELARVRMDSKLPTTALILKIAKKLSV